MTEFLLTLDPSAGRSTSLLNGEWEIAGGDANAPSMPFARTLPVPSLVDCAVPPYEWQQFDYHWYRAYFSVRGEGELRSVFLKLHQSMYGTAVWINGEKAGESIGCYTSQEFKIDEYCSDGLPNEMLIRVGAKHTLPPESAVGRDQEKELYAPGIWGDVELFACGEARVNSIQTVPHRERGVVEVRVTVENYSSTSRHVTVTGSVCEKKTRRPVSDAIPKPIALSAYGIERITFQIPIEGMQLWSVESPFLYETIMTVEESGVPHDRAAAVFGMRDFKIVGRDFYLNGKKIFLRGSNIALHRFFSDRRRCLLPWNEGWVKKILIDIPKAHHFNFFRNHIGPLYHRWYDIADEYGILLQNEWPFWCSTGTKPQIMQEFSEWIADACNHPSIVMWDPLNESSDDVIRYEIVPEMKKLDPTRPWESVDCIEQHPYIYSLGMVLNNRKFGFANALDEIEQSPTPSVVNEFLWWWLTTDNIPASLMKGVTERWLGRTYSRDELIGRQSFLAQELIELFRRMRVKAIQPFVYLSNNDGPTGNWFEGDIADARPKPVLAALKNAFAPFGLSIELWDRHFTTGEQRDVRIFVFNDTQMHKRGTLRVSIADASGDRSNAVDTPAAPGAAECETFFVAVPPTDTAEVPVSVAMPDRAGSYVLRAELVPEADASISAANMYAHGDRPFTAVSEKIVHVFAPVPVPPQELTARCAVLDPSGEIGAFLGIAKKEFAFDRDTAVLITHGNVVSHPAYQRLLPAISAFVQTGGTLLVIEPEYKIVGSAAVALVNDVELSIAYRPDIDKGGYDSYVFAEDESHPLWKGIGKEHMKMFNGAYGGEVVSQYDVTPSVHHRVHASCGLELNVKALVEIHYAKGKILVSRLQCRGRLVAGPGVENLFARRPDPVMQRLLINMIEYALPAGKNIHGHT
jgi:beta-galactosidase